jgi:D-serine deaminase-like pyridoxal phosphate-dependent protein
MNVDLATPCLVIDVERLDANIARMAASAASRDLLLRPHAKTHKSPEVARRQIAAGARGLTVATVAEAELFADAGFDDLLLAYPIYATAAIGQRLRGLLERAHVRIGVDSVESARALAAQLGHDHRKRLQVLVEVDCGQHRSGVRPDSAGELAVGVAHTGLEVVGVFTFPGHSYAPDAGRQSAADEEAEALNVATTSLRDQGIEPSVISGGSTPSVDLVRAGAMTEMRPGVYVFGDAQQWELETTSPEAIALSCLATVVSHAGGNVILDSGSKALGADRAAWATGYGRLLDYPEARITLLSEHHAVVGWPDHVPRPERGSHLRVVPNHVCNAVNLADELFAFSAGELVERWPVAARGANT